MKCKHCGTEYDKYLSENERAECCDDAVIEAQQQEINELKKKLNDEENRHAELQSRCFDNGYATGDSIFNENDELKAHVERLREALAAVWNDDSTSLTDRTIRRINTVMIMTPKQSLESYRNSVIDEVVGRAEQACRYAWKHQDMEDSEYARGFEVGCDVCEGAIKGRVDFHLKELKDKGGEL